MADLLQAELKLLTADVQQIVLLVNVETDDDGKQIGRKLGPAVRAVLRPKAAVQVLLSRRHDIILDSRMNRLCPMEILSAVVLEPAIS